MTLDSGTAVPDKARDLVELTTLTQHLRRQGKSVVWTNGFFEILHAGHIEFLLKAARLADVFIVGVNSDSSVAAAKGVGHPLSPEADRVAVLSAVECIDYITVFSEADCTHILDALAPDVYAKGLRHLHGGINEAEREIIEAQGGCIALIAGDARISTDTIVERIRTSAPRGKQQVNE